MGVLAKVGVDTSPTSATTKAVTGIGFTPKAVINFGVEGTADGANTEANLCLGAATATSAEASVSVSADTGVTTSNTDRRHANAAIWSLLNSGVVVEEADLSAIGSDGFTRNFTTATAAANIINHLCLGGDIEASLVQFSLNTASSTFSVAHGLSARPDALVLFTSWLASAPPFTDTFVLPCIGTHAGGSSYSAIARSVNAVTTTICKRYATTASVITQIQNASVAYLADVSSIDGENVNFSASLTSSGTFVCWMLAITGCRAQVGTFDFSLSREIACAGILPKAILGISGQNNGAGVINDAILGLFASDGTTDVSCGFSDEHGLVAGSTPTNARRWQDSDDYSVRNKAGTEVGNGNFTFADGLITVGNDVAHTTAISEGGYLILGDAIPASSGYGYGRAAYGYPGAYG